MRKISSHRFKIRNHHLRFKFFENLLLQSPQALPATFKPFDILGDGFVEFCVSDIDVDGFFDYSENDLDGDGFTDAFAVDTDGDLCLVNISEPTRRYWIS